MKKKKLFFSSLLMLMSVGMAHGQTTSYAYVQKADGSVATSNGVAEFSIPENGEAKMSFDSNGNVIMKIGDNTVAKLPMLDGAALAAGFQNGTDVTTTNSISTTVPDNHGWATLFSPFQLQVKTNSSNIGVYAPTYASSTLTFGDNLNDNDKIIPAGTGLILKGAGTIAFDLMNGAPTETAGSLSGIAIETATSTLKTAANVSNIYALGKPTGGEVGFYKYTGTNLDAGKAYLAISSQNHDAKGYIGFDLGGETTAISNVDASLRQTQDKLSSAQALNGKFIENGRVVILKSGQKYNLNGQEVK